MLIELLTDILGAFNNFFPEDYVHLKFFQACLLVGIILLLFACICTTVCILVYACCRSASRFIK